MATQQGQSEIRYLTPPTIETKKKKALEIEYNNASDQILNAHKKGKSRKVALDIADSMSGQNRVNARRLTNWTYSTQKTKESVKKLLVMTQIRLLQPPKDY